MNQPVASKEDKPVLMQSAELSTVDANGWREDEIRAVLKAKNRWLTFPTELEKQYLEKYIPRAIRRFHVLMPVIILLYIIIISGIIDVIPKQSFTLWMTIVISVTISILCPMALSFFPKFNPWIKWYGTLGSIVVITATVIVTNLFPIGQSSPLLYAGIIFAILIVYTCVGLTFLWGLSANLLGVLLAIFIMGLTDIIVNWSLLNRIYICASILGLGLSYALENQERKNFLNTLLLRLAVQKGENLAKQLESLSRLDSLTGIANRRHLNDVLRDEWNRALRQNHPLTIMLIDVDHFKRYNDQFGHIAGDHCLRQVAQLVAKMTHRSGELAARFGGEEFVLVYPAMDVNIAKIQATRLLSQIAQLAIPHPNGDFVSFSIGICVSTPTTDLNIEQLLHHADTALYQAKANGRNRYELYNEFSDDVSD